MPRFFLVTPGRDSYKDARYTGGYFIPGKRRMGALEDRIATAEAKLKQLKAEQQRIETRKKAAAIKRRRQDDTRRKILAGAVLLAQVESGEWPEAKFKAMMDKGLTRDEDRALFELTVSEEPAKEQP